MIHNHTVLPYDVLPKDVINLGTIIGPFVSLPVVARFPRLLTPPNCCSFWGTCSTGLFMAC